MIQCNKENHDFLIHLIQIYRMVSFKIREDNIDNVWISKIYFLEPFYCGTILIKETDQEM